MTNCVPAEPYYPPNSVCLAEMAITRSEFERLVGPPHRPSDKDDNEPGPCCYWSFQFSCGLHAFMVHHNANQFAAFFADAPELDHVLDHLDFPQDIRARVLAVDSDFLRRHYGPSQRWILWRQDTHGNRFQIRTCSSQRTADCLRARLESSVHKQAYWTEPAGPS